MRVATCVAALCGAALASASLLPVLDTPYVEVVPSRWVPPNSWSAGGQILPTSWNRLPGACASMRAAVLLHDADAAQPPTAWLVCTSGDVAAQGVLFNPASNATLSLPASLLGASCAWASAPAAWPATLLAVCNTTLYAVSCDADAARCKVGGQLSTTLPPAASSGGAASRPLLYAYDPALALAEDAEEVVSVSMSVRYGSADALSAFIAHRQRAVAAAAAARTTTPTMYIVYSVATSSQGGGTTYVLSWNGTAAASIVSTLDAAYLTAAYSDVLLELTLGNASSVVYADPLSLSTRYFEWVTYLPLGMGGVYDDVPTAMVYAPDGALYVGNAVCLNVRYANTTVVRFAGPQGLPWGNITAVGIALAADGSSNAYTVWLGTNAGTIAFTPSAPALPSISLAADEQALVVDTTPRWRFFYGPRYMPVSEAGSMNSNVTLGGLVCAGNNTLLITDGGAALLQSQWWTLSQKASVLESTLPRHDRFGQVAECSLSSWGVLEDCVSSPSDNNGLWTSLVFGAFAFQYGAQQNVEAAERAWYYFDTMRELMTVTGVRGLIARSFTAPSEACPTGWPWHASTAQPGYCWKGDTSSDEVAGHTWSYSVMARLVAGAPGSANFTAAVTPFLELASYITANNFTLVDVTGEPTRWGHWEPAALNMNRNWSDCRGPNSIEILSLLTAAQSLSSAAGNASAAAMFSAARDRLMYDAGYLHNIVNARINAPIDENFSDDELEWLSYFALFWGASPAHGAPAQPSALLQAAQLSIGRSWRTRVQSLRSDLWNAIYLAAAERLALPGASLPADAAAAAAADMVWNLRTWPLDLIDWPVHNSQRLDIALSPLPDRFGASDDATTVLPANERDQGRWNGDVFTLDGGSASIEMDPGAWMLPYWMARYFQLVSA